MEQKDRQKRIAKLQSLIQELSPKEQSAVIWLIRHFHVATELVKAERMEPDEWEASLHRAIESDDALMKILLLYHKIYWEEQDKIKP